MTTLINKKEYSLKTISVYKSEVVSDKLIPEKTITHKGRFIWSKPKIITVEAHWEWRNGRIYANNISDLYHVVDGKLIRKPWIQIEFNNETKFTEQFIDDAELEARIRIFKEDFGANMFEIKNIFIPPNRSWY